MKKTYFKIREVVDYLKLDSKDIRKLQLLCRNKQVTAVKVGTAYVINEEQLPLIKEALR